MVITQKIHGTNAQIFIEEVSFIPENEAGSVCVDDRFFKIRAGSRNRWLFVDVDNFGFAAFVESNAAELIEFLGEGRHFGEWAGPGINSGEGLTEKTFILFDWWKYPEDLVFPKQVRTVPILYMGVLDTNAIKIAMEDLKKDGSVLVPGFMRPEGVVTSINGQLVKTVFEAEDTQWTKAGAKGPKGPKKPQVDYSHLLQPIRLEKLLSKDEAYSREYPETLPAIVKAYVNDLIDEQQIVGDKDQIKAITKGATGQIFKFIKTIMETGI